MIFACVCVCVFWGHKAGYGGWRVAGTGMVCSALSSSYGLWLPAFPGSFIAAGHLAFKDALRRGASLRFHNVGGRVRSPGGSDVVCVEALESLAETKEAGSNRQRYSIPFITADDDGVLQLRVGKAAELAPQVNADSPSLQLVEPVERKRVGVPKRAARQHTAVKGRPKYSKAARRFYNEKFRVPQRLSKVLAAAGVASRRSSEEVISAGRVTVNGAVCKVPQTPVDPLKDTIYIDGRSLPRKLAPKLYFALNKPRGYICSNGENQPKSVLSLFHDYMKIWVQKNLGVAKPRLFTVGRLDVATSGLLFVTNDGEFAFKVSHPSSGLTKEYIATVEEKVTKRQVQAIADGMVVQRVHCVPLAVELLEREQGEIKQRLRIVVCEGRNHEVRHLVENAGLQIHSLKRVRIGGFRLPRMLGLGKYLLLSEAEVKKLFGE